MQSSTLSLAEQLKRDLHAAMKAREPVRVATLRTLISALDNATAVEVDRALVPMEGHTPDVPRREVSEDEQLAILRTEAAGRQRAAAHYEELGKADEAARLRAELAVITEYVASA